MDVSIVGRCCFSSKTLSILICKDTKHSDICSQICTRFKELQADEIELTYAIEEHSSCLLETEMDLRVLHLSLSKENVNAIDINVIRAGGKVFGSDEQDKID
ncbi:PREDICTED: PRUPE_1G325400 [Prunus dulcis]|uniref:PREDICTED: PRUPE_1G325400 n=1 Tax=Prunus dulcis TaxID=3755 RepID=A0A5E4GIE0_PRUDU|nr:PREDICTED: PRUPE_1G325400 [Prunus dulcis]